MNYPPCLTASCHLNFRLETIRVRNKERIQWLMAMYELEGIDGTRFPFRRASDSPPSRQEQSAMPQGAARPSRISNSETRLQFTRLGGDRGGATGCCCAFPVGFRWFDALS